MSSDDFLRFDTDKLDLDNFNLKVSSTIPEDELLQFASFEPGNDLGQNNAHISFDQVSQNQAQPQNINPSSLIHGNSNSDNFGFTENNFNDAILTSDLDPNALLKQVSDSYTNQEYLSPVGSPYSTASFQPQSIQQSLSHSLSTRRTRQGSISNSFQQRQDSIYDTLDSISSPQPHNLTDFSSNSQYFSPANTKIQQRHNSISLNSIASPSSYNDTALSPYNSSFDPSSFKSPRSFGASPITSTSLNSSSLPKNQLSKEDKLRRRREFHNQVERRRRDLIKEKIKELGLIVPPSLLYVDNEGKEVKASKSVIINRTVDYVAHLHKVMDKQQERRAVLLKKIEEIESQFGALTTNSNGTSINEPKNDVNTDNSSGNNINNINSTTPQSIGYINDELINEKQSYNDSPPRDFRADVQGDFDPNIKLEEFDVNQFLKEHNQTWNSNI